MKNLIFKAAPMFKTLSTGNNDTPDYFTVLCKEKGSKQGWAFCSEDQTCKPIKLATLEEAQTKCKQIKANHELRKQEIPMPTPTKANHRT